MFFRAVKETSETGASLESMDLAYLFKINEYLDIQNFIESEIEKKVNAQANRK